VGEKISAGCGLYGTGGCGEHGWTERSCWARLLAALALAPFGAAPLVARSKPNFHRNNDRKSECELQGCVHCGLSRFLHAGEQASAKSPPRGSRSFAEFLCRGCPSKSQGKKPRPTKNFERKSKAERFIIRPSFLRTRGVRQSQRLR
jgi:hypothetical protein